jgi:hypothetical protein
MLKIGVKRDIVTDYKTVFYIETKNGNCTHIRLYSLNPLTYIKSWIHNISWLITKKYYKSINQEFKLCQGCGEGIATYRIKDPNKKYNTNVKFNCCNHCVDFYDMHWSARKIIGWNTKILILGKAKVISNEPILEKKRMN